MTNINTRPRWNGVWARISEEFPLCTCVSCKKPLYLLVVLALDPIMLKRQEQLDSTTQFLMRDSTIIFAEPRDASIETYGGRMLQVAIDFSIVEEVASKLKMPIPQEINSHVALTDRSLALLLRSLNLALYEPAAVSALKADLLGRAIAAHALCNCTVTAMQSSLDTRFDTQDLKWLRDHIRNNIQYRLVDTELAAKLGVSPQTLRRRFKASIGMTPKAFVMLERIHMATKLLTESSIPIGDVAHNCGFTDHSHMCAVFVRRFGQSPTDIRNGSMNSVWTDPQSLI
ncbi:helix-turn-helix transcriptional regulator [uncultured Stenotrophomonas sp.]|uniref:helix-turn-helix transcriptional regulator n=1 Tax=uncultured Stenotrophomonas sp. TaxID=165438 RepID=UPI0025D9CC50|nr:AraC family transcriptional regulator [uncultured Stenotrophomonas sp.]